MKKRISFVTSNLANGGAQRVVSTLSLGLSSHYSVQIILNDGENITYPHTGQIIDLKTPPRSLIFQKLITLLVRTRRLKKLKISYRPSAVISFMEGSNLINIFSGGSGKKIISVRNYKSKRSISILEKIIGLLIKLVYGRSDLIVVPSKGIQTDLINSFRIKENKITVIHNPYNINYILDKAEEPIEYCYKHLNDEPYLLTVGSLTRQKGQWHLIRTFKKLKMYFPRLKLVILGEGDLRKCLEDIAKVLQLVDDIILPGFIKNPFSLMSRASLFVLPSLTEGFPNALVESMICGSPVIAADCRSGPREILAPDSDYRNETDTIEYAEYGVLIPVCSGYISEALDPLSPEEILMAEAIRSIIQSQELHKHYKVKSIQRSYDFRLEKIIKEWVDVIEA